MKDRSNREIVADIYDLAKRTGIFSLTFAHEAKLSEEQRRAAEIYLKQAYVLWWNSWIAPRLDELCKRKTFEIEVSDLA